MEDRDGEDGRSSGVVVLVRGLKGQGSQMLAARSVGKSC